MSMAGESTTSLCPKCRRKLIWDGTAYLCLSCDFRLIPKSSGSGTKSRKRADPRK